MEKRNGKTEWKNGEKNNKIKIAQKMLEKKFTIEQIMEITELTKEEIEEIEKIKIQ